MVNPLDGVSRLFARLKAQWFGSRIPAQCARIYFESVQAEYFSQKGLPGSRVDAEAKTKADELEKSFKDNPNGQTMNDALLYERVISRLVPVESLRRKVLTARGRYRRMITPEDFQGYIETSPPNPIEASEAELQADLDDLLGRMQWVYVLSPFREVMRSRISIRIVVVLIATILVMAALAWQFYNPVRLNPAAATTQTVPTLVVALFMGLIGGMVSVQQRIQSAPTDGDAIRSVLSLHNGMLSIYMSPVIGAISAGLLYLLLIGGYLKGDLFPELATSECGTSVLDLRAFLYASGPLCGTGYAKLMIWAFLAGFAERLVPDSLSRLVGAVESPVNQPPRPVVELPSTGAPKPRPGAVAGAKDVAEDAGDQGKPVPSP